MEIELVPRQTPGATVSRTTNGWRLDIPAGACKTYRLAQLDDYSRRPRRSFPHAPPLTFSLRSRVSAACLPGTWGFGLWNDPFGLSLGFGGMAGRLPAMPNAAWFFHASPENHLSLGVAPGNGFFAGTVSSPPLSALLFAPSLLALPLLTIRPLSRLLRRLAGRIIRQDGAGTTVDVTQWHEYSIHWLEAGCMFTVDGNELLITPNSPRPPLGLVLWIDNQFAAWTPEGRVGYGTLENVAARMEIEGVKVDSQ